MEPKIIETNARNILNGSKVYEYTINPYTGCTHGCHYCYARFMKRFLKVNEDWGRFVYAKINAPKLLAHEIKGKKKAEVWISGVCDPYQPVEETYRLTRSCLKILLEYDWPVVIQTKSNLILQDIELLKSFSSLDVYLTITTGDDKIRRLFEPNAPSIEERINALKRLNQAGIRTHIMIAPLLIGAETLVEKTKGFVYSVLIDKMNYHYGDWVYRKHGIEWARKGSFFNDKAYEIKNLYEKEGIPCEILF